MNSIVEVRLCVFIIHRRRARTKNCVDIVGKCQRSGSGELRRLFVWPKAAAATTPAARLSGVGLEIDASSNYKPHAVLLLVRDEVNGNYFVINGIPVLRQ